VLLGETVQLGLDLRVVLRRTGLQLVQGLLLHAFEAIQRAIALDGVFDDFLNLDAGGVKIEFFLTSAGRVRMRSLCSISVTFVMV